MSKSSSSIIGNPNKDKWDWNFENPGWFDCAKVNCANYQTISYDAALRVIKNFPNDKKLIDKSYWAKHFVGHILLWHPGSNKKNKKCSRIIFLYWIIKNFHFFTILVILKSIINKLRSKIFNQNDKNLINNSDLVFLANKGVYKITEFADYLEKKLAKH